MWVRGQRSALQRGDTDETVPSSLSLILTSRLDIKRSGPTDGDGSLSQASAESTETCYKGVLLFRTSEDSSVSQADGFGILLKGLMDYILGIKILMAMTTYRCSLESVLNWIWNFNGPRI